MSDPNGKSHKSSDNGNDNGNGEAHVMGRGRGRGLVDEGGQRIVTTDSESGKRSGSETEHGGDVAKRGKVREGRNLNEVLKTKPKHVESKQGKDGAAVQLLTNHFRLNFNAGFEVRHFRVDFAPITDDLRIRRQLLHHIGAQLGTYIYDGANILYLTRTMQVTTFQSQARDGTPYRVVITDTNTAIPFTGEMGLMVLNTILRRAMEGLNLKLVQRNLFDPGNKIALQAFKLELWPGYITSIRQYEEDVLISCEISHKVMRLETVYDLLQSFIREGGDYRARLEKEVVGTVVLTDYNNMTYGISGIEWGMTPQSTFQTKDGPITFIQYYRQRHQKNIRDPQQPLLTARLTARDIRAGRTEPSLLVAELCRTTGLTDGMRANFQLMKSLGEYTRMGPSVRVDRLLKFANRLNQTRESRESMEKFNVSLAREMVRVPGRQLAPEFILFGEGRSAAPDARSADWTPALRNNKMYANEDCRKWFFIYPRRSREDSERFLKMMKEVAGPLGFNMTDPKCIEMNDDRNDTYRNTVLDAVKKDPKFIMCVLTGNPQTCGERYTCVKRIMCCQNAVPSQCIVQKTMQPKKGNMAGVRSIATKVVLQINCKLGGRPWMINMPMRGVMVCGFDVSHNTVSRSGESYGAFVATMDLKLSNKFFSSVARQQYGEETANTMRTHMQKALYAYITEHGTLPERIIMYRDGVSDGEMRAVFEQELTGITDMLSTMYKERGGEIKLAYVIVNKRINTKFFLDRKPQFDNPAPGTVVDNVVTLPERYDFYLVSQSVRQGTVSPTSYNIIYDTFGLNPDKQQMLAYKMCHLYYNWCGTTRVPCVVQYAHKLSILVGEHLQSIPHTGLAQKLYFL